MRRFIEFDFEKKTEKPIELDGVMPAIQAGHFVWLDLEGENRDEVRTILKEELGLSSDICEVALRNELDTGYDHFPDCLRFSVVSCHLEQGVTQTSRVDVLIGERFFVTISRAHAEFLGKVRKAYRADFLRFAKSPSFLIYEIWDHLIQTYELVEKGFQQEVERIQALLSQKVDDGIFTEVSQLNSALLYFRKHVAPARNVLTELSTRKSIFVSEPTQPFLLSMVAHLERILADVIVNRDIVRDSLDLYMSIVGYRTNMVMNRLTLVTFLFLPLTFLTGIYGMESVSVPSISWPVFWSMALTCFVLVLVALKRFKLL